MIKKLCMNQDAVVRIANGETLRGKIGQGVRQRCMLLPLLFSIYTKSSDGGMYCKRSAEIGGWTDFYG